MKQTLEAWALIMKPVAGVETVYFSTDADLRLRSTTLTTYPTRKIASEAARQRQNLCVVPMKVTISYDLPITHRRKVV
jgi:hypothetical protein